MPPRTEYVYVQSKSNTNDPPNRQFGAGQAIRNRFTGKGEQAQVKISNKLPSFLGNRRIIFYAWIIAMVVVGFDEWHELNILPRPARLWWTSLLFGLLALASAIEAIVPITNALALGYVLMLIWTYYNGTGQFAATKGASNG